MITTLMDQKRGLNRFLSPTRTQQIPFTNEDSTDSFHQRGRNRFLSFKFSFTRFVSYWESIWQAILDKFYMILYGPRFHLIIFPIKSKHFFQCSREFFLVYFGIGMLKYEPSHEKTNNLLMRKQRRRPASR